MDLEILEKLKNDCESKIKQALSLLIEADDMMLDIIQNDNSLDNRILSDKIYRVILIIKDVLDI